jgi:site-specific DNA recombinase
MRAGLYARVSREEAAEGYSLDEQLEAMRRFCRERKWTVVAEYVEPGHTGTVKDRPAFTEALGDCEAGKLDILLTHQLDRFYRNLQLQLETLGQLGRWNVGYLSVTEQIDYSTPQGMLFLSMLGAFNEYYVANLRREIRKGKRGKARRGLTNSRTSPFGYRRVDGLDIPDEEAIPGVLLAFESYASGEYSDAGIAELLNMEGYKPSEGSRTGHWTIGAARHLLMNRYYIGEVRHRGDWFLGQHKPIVGRELFERAQQARARRTTNRTGGPKGRVYLLHRVAKCSRCGRFLHVSPKRNWDGSLRPYYTEPGKVLLTDCPAAGRHVRQDMVDPQVEALVKQVRLPDDWRDRLGELAEHRADVDQVEDKRKYLQGRLRRLRDLYLDGDFSKAEYDQRRADLKAELDALRTPEAPAIEQAAETLQSLADIWDGASLRIRRDMLRTIFEGIYVDMLNGQVVCVKPFAPFVALFRMDGLEEREDGRFYPREEGKEA